MNRKVRKLLKSPSLFVRDMVKNQASAAGKRLPRLRTVNGSRRYSVVAAVYGVEDYLEDFFRSLVRQSLHFERHLELIMVDDGSVDGSAEIIAKWQEKYPRSIRYVRKENGGQASARNLGLQYATGDWVTFIDPDDFVDESYFACVEAFLDREDAQNVALLSCNFIPYDEKTRRFKDAHPLRYRFRSGDRIVAMSELASDIQLTVNSALFRRDLLIEIGTRFDEAIRPSFEDAHFANSYLLGIGTLDVGFCASARYYYRKRADENSTLDRAWTKESLYDEVLDRGCLDLFRRAEAISEDGEIPVWLQRVVLYHLIWYFKRLVNNAEALSFLSDEQRERFMLLLGDLVSRLDASTILSFELGGAWLYYKVGMLGLFKQTKAHFQHVYVETYDPTKELVQLRYFFHGDSGLEVFTIDGQEIFPVFAKERRHALLDETFVLERIVWLPLAGRTGRFDAVVGEVETRLVVRQKVHRGGVGTGQIVRLGRMPSPASLSSESRLEYRLATNVIAARLYRDAFLFMDRDTQADDNAEHLYRHVAAAHPEINAFFVLQRTSHDWERLEQEGFRLLAFGSLPHRLALLNARHLISSHTDHYVVTHPKGRELTRLMGASFTFLQHGVTKDDISNWLNSKKIDCLVTASPAEYASIVDSGTPYKYTSREVVLSGFPRHDALGAQKTPPERLVVIMPTWRQSLVGRTTGRGNERELNPGFFESEYARTWKHFLHAPELRRLVEEHGFRVKFFPHANIQPYLDWFAPPAFIETVSHRPDGSMQQTFQSAAIMLTDYSSTAFEMAYLRKAVLYYQFDRDLVFGGGHLTKKGYYDYGRDGFGPVCDDEPALLSALSQMMTADAVPSPEYADRMDRAFAFRDGHSCERTLDAIRELDRAVPLEADPVLVVEAARDATRRAAWSVAESRWAGLLEWRPEARPPETELRLAEAKRQLGKVDEAGEVLAAIEAEGGGGAELDREWAELATTAHDWARAVGRWADHARSDGLTAQERGHALVRLAGAHRQMGAYAAGREVLEGISAELESVASRTERAELATAAAEWEVAAARWGELVADPDAPEQSLLRLAEALARLGLLDRALTTVGGYLETNEPRHELRARSLRLELSAALRSQAAAEPHAALVPSQSARES